MESYSDFAYLYDTFMEDVPYDDWADLLSCLIKAYGGNVKTVLDLGCGTGNMTMRLAKAGFDVMGVDNSEDMLSVASEKSHEEGLDILYVNQDMRELELLEKQDCIVSICDCINYLVLDEDLISTFEHVKDCLSNDGLFIFDIKTVHMYENVMGNTTIAENRDDCSFIWENYYSVEDHINEYDVTFFKKVSDEEDGLFKRFEETHIQRALTIEELKDLILKCGLRFVTVIDEKTRKEPTADSERVFIVCRK
ncbi:MAG: class I SAM-dependent methyltransferase [Lachnospiraceae bacterium]|nr:class I SAM-dependent methyltransferase [Lachnospiraceae bacterium]